MPLSTENIPQQIRDAKKRLRKAAGDYKRLYEEICVELEKDVERIQRVGSVAVPVVDYDSIVKNDGLSAADVAKIRAAGCVVVKGTVPEDETLVRNQQLQDYIVENGYYETAAAKGVQTDSYFSQLKPQIFGIYWSKTQIWARQHENMANVRKHLNRVWKWRDNNSSSGEPTHDHFDPDINLAYADRIRRREPGDTTLGLKAHVDAGSIERWIEPNYSRVYQKLFSLHHWRQYDAFDGAYRTLVEEFRSPAVCSVFRTYQGWLAMTPQGPGDGTLQLIPSTLALPYMLLRAIQDDVTDDDLCGAAPGRALAVSPHWHPLLCTGALVSIPKMDAGDTVFWHPDTIHGLEAEHGGTGYSNVVYVGAVPGCNKNRRFLAGQAEAFKNGQSCPDFAPEHYEITYEGRATVNDLTELGRLQMGLS